MDSSETVVLKERETTLLFALLKKGGLYVLSSVLALLGAIFVLGLWDVNLLEFPFLYRDDAIWNAVLTKTLIDTGGYLTNSQLGAPGIFQLFDFPLFDGASFLLLKAITCFSSNWAVVNNVFYLLTYPLCAMTALFVFRSLGLSNVFSIVASVLFSLLPYHFQHGEEHLLLTAYFVAPLAIWLAIKVLRNELLQTVWAKVGYGVICFLAGATGIYYAFFSAFFILLSGMISSFNWRSVRPLKTAVFFVGVIGVVVFAQILPTLLYHAKEGPNLGAYKRSVRESEVFGIKMTQMLLPVDHDRISALAHLKKKYNRNTITRNENTTATLGLIGSVGFVALLCLALVKKKKDTDDHENLCALSALNLCGVLLATTGGFASIFALLVSPSIRCYNRISLFLAFFSLAAFFLLFQQGIKRWHGIRFEQVSWGYGLLLLLFGVWNQTSGSFALKPQMETIKSDFLNDRRFIQRVDVALPENSMIFQLPYCPFPEGGMGKKFGDYDHCKAILHSRSQRWSFGGMKGREVSAWQEAASALPTEKMIEELLNHKFSGLFLNRSGYHDRAQCLEEEVTRILHSGPLESEDGNILFWDIRSFNQHEK